MATVSLRPPTSTSRLMVTVLVLVWVAVVVSSVAVFRQYSTAALVAAAVKKKPASTLVHRHAGEVKTPVVVTSPPRDLVVAPFSTNLVQATEQSLVATDHYDAAVASGLGRMLDELHLDESHQYDALLRPTRSLVTASLHPACDVDTVPFASHRNCEDFLSDSIHWLSFEPLAPKFEQRTIKFTLQLQGGIQAIAKVPQALFPTEPFSEVGAWYMDRHLRVNRVPPTVLVPVSITMLANIASRAVGVDMVEEFNTKNLTWAQWVAQDFVEFVTHEKSGHLMKNSTHVWCSLQLVLREVVPLLVSQLKLPYSKANSGWHRWFNPEWEGYVKLRRNVATTAALMAVSQIAMFDYIILNNDRSPNKNNFVVKGCLKDSCAAHKKPSVRAAKGLPATFVHLDQGMSFNGFQQPHNPIAKPKNSTFCSFYAPFVQQVNAYVTRLANKQQGSMKPGAKNKGKRRELNDAVQSDLLELMPIPVVGMIGKNKFWLVGQNIVRLLNRVVACANKHGVEKVLVTAHTQWE